MIAVQNQPLSAEAAVLHAIIEEDEDEAERLLGDFLPGELERLSHQGSRLMILADHVRVRKERGRGR